MEKLQRLYAQYRPQILFVLFSFLFLMLVRFTVKRQIPELMGLPVLLIGLVMAIENFKNIWYLAVAFVPLSFGLEGYLPGVNITFPSDVLCMLLLMLTLFKMISEHRGFLRFYNHPIFWVIVLWFLWMFFPVVASTMPGVSAKFMISYLWTVMAFYFLSTLIFRNPGTIIHFFMLMGISFAIAFGIVFMLYVGTGRNPFALRFNPMPFFNDHTVFGAFTAMYVPIFWLLTFHGKFSRGFRLFAGILLIGILSGLFFSYSRGAWMSTLAGLGLMWLLMARHWIKRLFIPILIVLAGIGTSVYLFSGESGGKQEAVSRKDITQHVLSVSNWKTDDSNAERINRWKTAIAMYGQSPVFGYGPGTYAMHYGDFQKATDRTGISTNHGDNGTAHNEFLLALAETGMPGMILTLLLFILPIFYGIRGYLRARVHNIRILYLGAAFGLFVYFIHAWVNNFLDQDKIGASFFGMLAVITALDVFHLRKERFARLGKQATETRLNY